MNRLITSALALAASLTVGIAISLPAAASAFWGGTVINIAPTDTLKIRKWPAASSQIIDAHASGATISMTGRCKNIITNTSFRIDAGGSANWKYSRMKKPNVWCQVMTDDAQLGWARGRFIWPE
ncbi:MAG: hypothetical protein ACRCU5_05805 [Rhizobiaceae bacterium]